MAHNNCELQSEKKIEHIVLTCEYESITEKLHENNIPILSKILILEFNPLKNI